MLKFTSVSGSVRAIMDIITRMGTIIHTVIPIIGVITGTAGTATTTSLTNTNTKSITITDTKPWPFSEGTVTGPKLAQIFWASFSCFAKRLRITSVILPVLSQDSSSADRFGTLS